MKIFAKYMNIYFPYMYKAQINRLGTKNCTFSEPVPFLKDTGNE